MEFLALFSSEMCEECKARVEEHAKNFRGALRYTF